MKVAIPEYQGRVAPVLDSCRRILIYLQTPQGDQVIGNEDWSTTGRHIRPERLRQLGVEAILCGGISCWMEEQILLRGIKLVPWLAGDIGEILSAHRAGKVFDPQYAMPGWAGCRRRHRGQSGPRVAASSPTKAKKGVGRCRDLIEQDR